jgi:ferredoxin-NADP reductase/nitrite reductase/ring-hydroxylating ferredoxin subunit
MIGTQYGESNNRKRLISLVTYYYIMTPPLKTGLKKTDFQEGKLAKTNIEGKSVVLVMLNGKLFAMDSVCSHEGGPLEDGLLEGYNLICPWHQGIFDIRNAKASPETSWVSDLNSYSIIVDEKSGEISIETFPSDTSLKNNNKSVSGQRGIVNEEIVPTKPLKLQLKLLEKTAKKGTDVMSFKFSRNDEYNHLDYKAGQYAIVDLGTKEDPKGPTRSFTMASSPTEDGILITTRIRDTPFKKKLASLDIESTVNITSPMGEFVLPDDNSKSIVFLSGGIGVTPFRSMVKYVTDNQVPSKITMFDSNRNIENTLFKAEFDDCLKHNNNLKIIYTISEEEQSSNLDEWRYEQGRINKAMIEKYLSGNELESALFYVCGPPAMLNAMKQILKDELKVPDERIKIEEFTGY